MKYIRTKDGRIYQVRNEQRFYFNCADKFGIMEGVSIHKDIIIKQADTIEELCDEFVVYVKDCIKANRIFPKGKAMEYGTYLEQSHNLNNEIYGAIWTDKGLKYVAKMNDKGELELL